MKVGTTLLSNEHGFDGRILEQLVKELAAIKRERAMNILIVSSGAIGCGMNVLGLGDRPKSLPLKQATAAVGQSRLMHYYETLFQTYGDGLRTAQVLLTVSELDNRETYLNIRNTLHAIFELEHVIPVVNENDSVAVEELRFGDNDTLSARVAAEISADLLIVLSDIDGLYDRNPRQYPDARLIPYVERVTPEIEALAGDTLVETSVGGMRTKLRAARIAGASGVPMVICDGRRPRIIHDVLAGTAPMTWFDAAGAALSHRKRWIAFGRAARGAVHVDAGARDAIVRHGRSLLPAGVTAVSGAFQAGAAVQVIDPSGKPIARGLANYSSEQLNLIKGAKSGDIERLLGRKGLDEVIHRDNLVLI